MTNQVISQTINPKLSVFYKRYPVKRFLNLEKSNVDFSPKSEPSYYFTFNNRDP